MRNLIILLLLVVGGIVGLTFWLNGRSRAASQEPRREPVDRGPITIMVSGTGRIVPKDARAVVTDVPAGRVKTISPNAEVGRKVEKGQVLVTLDDDLARARLKHAQSGLQLAEAAVFQAEAGRIRAEAGEDLAKSQLELAQKNFRLAEEFKDTGARERRELAEKALEAAKKGVTNAEAGIKEAAAGMKTAEAKRMEVEAAMDAAQKGVDVMEIKAPISGVIIDKRVAHGQVVTPQTAPVLFLIAPSLEQMQVHVQVGEADYLKITDGMEARFTLDAYADRAEPFQGRVSQIAFTPTMTSRTVQLGEAAASVPGPVLYAITVDVVASEKSKLPTLRPGLTANVDFIVRELKDVLRVPNAALSYRPEPLDPREQKVIDDHGTQGLQPLWIWTASSKQQLVLIQPGATDGFRTEVVKTVLPQENYLQEGMEAVVEAPPGKEGGGLFDRNLGIKF